jgi:intein-encoded DNA endonuclease-like protein
MKYQLVKSNEKYANELIRRFDDSGAVSYIPSSQNNPDYQQYLAWLAEGNTPLPPDDPA